jgi:arginyl-tRNA synthetase
MRAQGIKPGDASWPTDPDNPESKAFYNGDYIQDIANDFLATKTVQSDDRSCTASGDVNDVDGMREFAVAYLRREQDLDLKAFDVRFDNYYLESSLYTSGKVDAAVQKLKDAGKTYEQDGALWLQSTDYGDDKDRVMRKGDGTYTYFVPDVAYHIAKWERGFTRVVNIQGTDHHGTIARVRAGLQAANVGIPEGYPDYVLHTMVRVMRGGEEVKISKRAGSYVTLRDLIEWTSKDAVRFFLLSRKPDTEYIFDIDLALAQNNDNPVYYVQYAHARICSVLAAWKEKDGGDAASLAHVDLSPLQSPQAHALMLALAKYPEMLTSAANDSAPHDVTFYLRDLASQYHSYYDAERILVDDEAVKQARLALVAATAQVLRNGLKVLGVSAPQKM